MSDLEQFVLDYVQEAGGLVEPPAYGVYEALLPEAVANRWRVPAYLQLAFAETDQADVTWLGYNHPLVEQMVQEANGRAASTRLYINDLHLDKSGIDELAAFAEEYHLRPAKIHYNRLSSLNGQPYGVARFELFGLWKNEEAINEARETFARLYWK